MCICIYKYIYIYRCRYVDVSYLLLSVHGALPRYNGDALHEAIHHSQASQAK